MREGPTEVPRSRRWPSWLMPSFDETALFMMAVTCLLLLVFPTGFRGDVASAVVSPFGLLVAWAVVGLVLSLVNAFTSHKKGSFEKLSMAVFAMVTNAAAGLAIGIWRFVGFINGGRLLAAVNVVTAVLLVYEVDWFEEECVPDDDARPLDLLFGVVALGVVFAFCEIRGLPWPITFSACVAYATLIHGNAIEVSRELLARARTDSAQ